MIFQRALLTSAILAAAGSLAACAVDTDSRGNAEVPGLIELSVLGSYVPEGDVFDESAAEIIAHDPSHQRLFVVNAKAATVDVLDISNPATPALIDTIDASREGASANSVAVYGDLVRPRSAAAGFAGAGTTFPSLPSG